MTGEEKHEQYLARGLSVETGTDPEGTRYEPHRHEQTYIYTVSGTLKLRLDDGPWIELGPGSEQVIQEGQLHEALVGDEGWSYVVGSAPKAHD